MAERKTSRSANQPVDLVDQIEEQEFRPGVMTYTCPKCPYSHTDRDATISHIRLRHITPDNPNDVKVTSTSASTHDGGAK